MAKRTLTAILGIILGAVSGVAWAGKVTVTEPSGKTWAEGSKHSVKWTGKREGIKGHYGGTNVRITLLYNGKYYLTLVASTPNDGIWSWKSIPNVGKRAGDKAAKFQIRVGPVKARISKGKKAGDRSVKFKIKE